MKYNYEDIVKDYEKFKKKLFVSEDEYNTICNILHCDIETSSFYNFGDYSYRSNTIKTDKSICYGGSNNPYKYDNESKSCYMYTGWLTDYCNNSSNDYNMDISYVNNPGMMTFSLCYTYNVLWKNTLIGEICDLTFDKIVNKIKKIKKNIDKENYEKKISKNLTYIIDMD